MEEVSTWVGMETLEGKEDEEKEDHVVWVMVPNGAKEPNDVFINNMSSRVTTETVTDANGHTTDIHITEPHSKKKMGRKNSNNSKFECDICGLRYSRMFNLKRHKESLHVPVSTIVGCPHCSSTFNRIDNLRQHIKIVHNNQQHKVCPVCGKEFARLATMQQHLSVQHEKIKKYQCDQCKETFGYAWSLYNHIRVKHENDGAFKCFYCSKVFSTSQMLRNHVLSIHEGVRYKCKICSKVLKCQSAYKAHLKSFHLPTTHNKYSCTRCSFKTDNSYHIRNHMMDTHSWSTVFICVICKKTLRHSSAFCKHLRYHNQNETIINQIIKEQIGLNCNLAGAANINIDKEINRKVLNEPVFQPSLIVGSLSDSENSAVKCEVMVKREESEDKKGCSVYQCTICDRVFNMKYLLERHYVKVHSHKCCYCFSTFFSEEAVRLHNDKFHKGESSSSFLDLKSSDNYDDPENIWGFDPVLAMEQHDQSDSGESADNEGEDEDIPQCVTPCTIDITNCRDDSDGMAGCRDDSVGMAGCRDDSIGMAGCRDDSIGMAGCRDDSVGMAGCRDDSIGMAGCRDDSVGMAGCRDDSVGMAGCRDDSIGMAGCRDDSIGMAGCRDDSIGMAGCRDDSDGMAGCRDDSIGMAGCRDDSIGMAGCRDDSIGMAGCRDDSIGMAGCRDDSIGMAGCRDDGIDMANICREELIDEGFQVRA